ncbi:MULTISPECIES: CBS domain-containing protein [unclassified Streptomyces]|uniref:CBS domain-containing protein n=1 Tax=unclassified Streptomyces TaxID=2593676 RepID=UPI00073C6E44|nr:MULTISPECIES: CBS domain-containing protein [unclassified Streptomyces]
MTRRAGGCDLVVRAVAEGGDPDTTTAAANACGDCPVTPGSGGTGAARPHP